CGAVKMKTMWAPWRIEYILELKKDGCVFCKALDETDDLTLFKGKITMVVMNKYPYINGHLLIAPKRHVQDLESLTPEEMTVLLKTVEQSVAALKKCMKPDGFNVGLNLGKVAGAGVEEHLHFHIVPRWFGDTNALTVFADVRVIPEHIRATFDKLKPYFENLDLTEWNKGRTGS
ncbi:MAG: HIT domain-containing protein, partial [Thermodesulfobacteriota bacterium]